MSVVLTGVGVGLPRQVISNAAFTTLGLSEEWIVSRTGIRHRHRLGSSETLAGLAVDACTQALVEANRAPADIDFIVAATSTADQISPGLAPEVAGQLGSLGVGAVDVNGACTGFLYALDFALAKIQHGTAERILVVAADAMSRITNHDDRNTAILFGDAAAAVVVERGGCDDCSPYFSFGSSPVDAEALVVDRATGAVSMDGASVYLSAVDAMSQELLGVLDACGLGPADVNLLIPHQANSRILVAVGRRLQWDPDRAANYVDRFGNTSAASIPLALWQARSDGRVQTGDRLAFSAFGAGFTWGAGVVHWQNCSHRLGRALAAAPSTHPTHAGAPS